MMSLGSRARRFTAGAPENRPIRPAPTSTASGVARWAPPPRELGVFSTKVGAGCHAASRDHRRRAAIAASRDHDPWLAGLPRLARLPHRSAIGTATRAVRARAPVARVFGRSIESIVTERHIGRVMHLGPHRAGQHRANRCPAVSWHRQTNEQEHEDAKKLHGAFVQVGRNPDLVHCQTAIATAREA